MKYTIGIDEVGRGALAGPVVVAAAMIVRGIKFGPTLKDSKKLSAKAREAWYAHFEDHPQISFAVARVYPRQIEKRNISGAANLAALRAYRKLTKNGAVAGSKRSAVKPKTEIFLDGGLFLGNGKLKKQNPYRTKTIIKADEKIPAVAIASIIAKVHRDRFMKKLSCRHPEYKFDIHKGYGTKIHLAAIAANGPCAIHRLTFLKKKTKV